VAKPSVMALDGSSPCRLCPKPSSTLRPQASGLGKSDQRAGGGMAAKASWSSCGLQHLGEAAVRQYGYERAWVPVQLSYGMSLTEY
jgi:hypothetical protein